MLKHRNKFITVLLFLLTLFYVVFSFVLHVEVTALVVGRLKSITGDLVPRNYSLEASIVLVLIIVCYVLYRAIKGTNRIYTFLFIYLYLIFVYYFYRVFSLHAVEYIHFVQYFGLVFLIGWTFDPDRHHFYFNRILFTGVMIGILDEVFQFYITARGHKYLDFNDFFLNTLGTIGGLLLYYGFYSLPLQQTLSLRFYKTKQFIISALIAAIVLVLLLTGYIQKTPPYPVASAITEIGEKTVIFLERIPGWLGYWRAHFVSGYFYNLNPLESMLLIAIATGLFSFYDPRILGKIGIGKKIIEYLK